MFENQPIQAPLNQVKTWHWLVVIGVLFVALAYALPNLYGEDPAVQISSEKTNLINERLEQRVLQTLEKNTISLKQIERTDKHLIVRLNSLDDQRIARELLQQKLGPNYWVALNLVPATPAWFKSIAAVPLKLGLDLRGGIHFLMQVDLDEAILKREQSYLQAMKSTLRAQKIRYQSVKRVPLTEAVTKQGEPLATIDFIFRDTESANNALDALDAEYRDVLQFNQPDDMTISAKMRLEEVLSVRDYAVSQNISTLRSRVNELGVAEPLVQRSGADRIVVQLPGVQDSARAKKILSATATLEFYEVDKTADATAIAASGRVPYGKKLLRGQDGEPYILKDRLLLTGASITNAATGFDENGMPQVNISLDSEGGRKINGVTKRLSTERPKGRLAVAFIEYKTRYELINGERVAKQFKVEEVITAPTVQSPLSDRFRITGRFSQAEAQNLSLLLRAGALAVPAMIIEERTIGPSLGQENIDRGLLAIQLGFALVLIFMVIYYKWFGLIANFALAFNLVLITALMSLLPGATLTLPGMAGIVLTVGMAVDANVLIFARIKEELRKRKPTHIAIDNGYSSAFSTILDANITTLIAAVILFSVGTGPIKGFAVTLTLGILCSMFTAIFVTRVFVNQWFGKKRTALPI